MGSNNSTRTTFIANCGNLIIFYVCHISFRPEGEHTKLLATEEWRLTKVNKDFSVCPTYAPVLLVPKVVTDEQIIQSAAYRDGGRFPILSYRHENGVSI